MGSIYNGTIAGNSDVIADSYLRLANNMYVLLYVHIVPDA
jgi:hypothetical protein